MQTVFRLVGSLMAGKRLSPELLAQLPDDDCSIIADHRVALSHISAAQLGWKRGQYVVTVTSPRIDGRWHLSSGTMEKLSREAAFPDG